MKRRITFLLTALALGSFAVPAVAEESPVVSDDDAKRIQDSAQDSLEFDKTLDTTKWVNPDTGNYGTITPTETYETDDGRYCREYHQTVTIGGVEQEAYGTACRTEDGSWEIARDESAVRRDEPDVPGDEVEVAENEAPTVVYRDRVVYVPERRRIYGYPVLYPFALSVGFGIRDDHYAYYGGYRNTYSRYGYGYRWRGHRHRGHSRGLTVYRGSRHRPYYRNSHGRR